MNKKKKNLLKQATPFDSEQKHDLNVPRKKKKKYLL
jgi:hypothetical protein